MSSTNDVYCTRLAHCALVRRTVTEIQSKIVEKKERNLLSRLAQAKHDKETIAAWNLDLIRILQVFNVRSAGSVRLSLTASFQTELALNTHNIVSDIHQNMLKGCEDADNQSQAVSSTSFLPITE